MTRIDFYLNAPSKIEIARKLAGKAICNNSKVMIYTQDEAFAREIDGYLWASPVQSFLPHALCGHKLAFKSPILIGANHVELSQPDVLINLDADVPDWFSRFGRLLEIVTVDPHDKDRARIRFRRFKENGYSLDVHDLKGRA